MQCVPRKKKCEDVKRQDPNKDSLCVQSYIQENNTDETKVLIWNVHVVEREQSIQNQRHEENNVKMKYHRGVQMETHFGELRMEDS